MFNVSELSEDIEEVMTELVKYDPTARARLTKQMSQVVTCFDHKNGLFDFLIYFYSSNL